MKPFNRISEIFMICIVGILCAGRPERAAAEGGYPWDQLNESEQQWVLGQLKSKLPELLEDGPMKDFADEITGYDIATISTLLGEVSGGDYENMMGFAAGNCASYLSEQFKENLPDGYGKQIYETIEGHSDLVLEIARAAADPKKDWNQVFELTWNKTKDAVMTSLQDQSQDAFTGFLDYILGAGVGDLYIQVVKAEIVMIQVFEKRTIRDTQNRLYAIYEREYEKTQNEDAAWQRIEPELASGPRSQDTAYDMAFRGFSDDEIRQMFAACHNEKGYELYAWLKSKQMQREREAEQKKRREMEAAALKLQAQQAEVYRKMQMVMLAAIREKKGEKGKEEAEQALRENGLIGQIRSIHSLIVNTCKIMEGLDTEYINAETIVREAIDIEKSLIYSSNPIVKEWILYGQSIEALKNAVKGIVATLEPMRRNADAVSQAAIETCRFYEEAGSAKKTEDAKRALESAIESLRQARQAAEGIRAAEIEKARNQLADKVSETERLKPARPLSELILRYDKLAGQLPAAEEALKKCNEIAKKSHLYKMKNEVQYKSLIARIEECKSALVPFRYHEEVDRVLQELDAIQSEAGCHVSAWDYIAHQFNKEIIQTVTQIQIGETPESIGKQAGSVFGIFDSIDIGLALGEQCVLKAILVVNELIKKHENATAFSISGQVLENGNAAEGASVTCRGAAAVTGSDGAFVLGGIYGTADEEFVVTASKSGLGGSSAVTFQGSDISGLAIALSGDVETEFTVSGQVLQDGRPASGARVSCQGSTEVTGADGLFLLSGLQARLNEAVGISAVKGDQQGGGSIVYRGQSESGIVLTIPPVPRDDITIDEAVEEIGGDMAELCDPEQIESQITLLHVTVGKSISDYSKFREHYGTAKQEINVQASNPAENGVVVRALSMMEAIAGDHQALVQSIQNLSADLLSRLSCPGMTLQAGTLSGMGAEAQTRQDDMSAGLADLRTRLSQYGADEETLAEQGEAYTDDDSPSDFTKGGGMMEEMPGDSYDQDGDGQQDEGFSAAQGKNVAVYVFDSGSAKDDAFRISIPGHAGGGTTAPGLGNYFYFDLAPGNYQVTLTVVLAPDNIGTYTVRIIQDGLVIKENAGSPGQGSTAVIDFTVK